MTPREEAERIEFSQQLVRKAIEMGGCCGLRAQVDDTTCLVAYPDNHHEWCPPCLLAAAADTLRAAEARGEARGRVQGLREAMAIAEYHADALDRPHTETRTD